MRYTGLNKKEINNVSGTLEFMTKGSVDNVK